VISRTILRYVSHTTSTLSGSGRLAGAGMSGRLLIKLETFKISPKFGKYYLLYAVLESVDVIKYLAVVFD